MKHRDKAYEWWKRKPLKVRKPLVLTFGLLLVIISPFTGLLPGPGGIPVFLLGIAILASEYDWAERIKQIVLDVLPNWLKRYWRITPKWLHFFDIMGGLIMIIGFLLIKWPLRLPIIDIKSDAPFFYLVPNAEQQWWIPAAVCIFGGIAVFIFNRNRINTIKKLLRREK